MPCFAPNSNDDHPNAFRFLCVAAPTQSPTPKNVARWWLFAHLRHEFKIISFNRPLFDCEIMLILFLKAIQCLGNGMADIASHDKFPFMVMFEGTINCCASVLCHIFCMPSHDIHVIDWIVAKNNCRTNLIL